jgi:4a-hydroxytetrahydrobiopterin dehydratase
MWTTENNKLTRTFVFRDFTEAFGFMARVAIVAEYVLPPELQL